MIVCKECGNAAESADGFCSSCGSLLEWSGQHVETPAGTAPARQGPVSRQPVAERARPGPVPLADQAVYAGPYCSACGVRNPEERTFCRSCGEPLRPQTVVYGTKRGWWRRMMDRLRGRREYAAGDRPRGFIGHDIVPGAAAGAAGAAAGNAAGGGHGYGGAAAQGLRPAGGHGLSAPGAHGPAPAGAQAHGGGLRHGMHAGDVGRRMRQTKSNGRRLLGRFAPLLFVLALLGIGLGPAREWITTHVFNLVHKVRNEATHHFVNVTPTAASASSAAHGHGASLAIDGVKQTYWLSGHHGIGATLTVRFSLPEKIDKIGLLSGEPGAGYRAEARPESVELIVGGQQPVTVTFDDTPDFQNRAVSLRGVTAMTVVIKGVYPGQHGQAVAITELEFFSEV